MFHAENIKNGQKAVMTHTEDFHLFVCMCVCESSLVAQMVKYLPAMRETWVQSLGWKDPLEKKMTTHPSTLAWKIP